MPETVRDSSKQDRALDGAEAERALGRVLSRVLPLAFIALALVISVLAPSLDAGRITINVGPALIVLACGALFAAIALLWASLRTLSGDAPLPAALEALTAQTQTVDAVSEQKRRVLRALKDLEAEHAIGKIDDADYIAVAARYREEAKAMMRRMDETIAPARAEAERMAREYVSQAAPSSAASEAWEKERGDDDAPKGGARVACVKCGVANEHDALFCKQCGLRFAATSEQGDAAS
jgi:hypothetical protein